MWTDVFQAFVMVAGIIAVIIVVSINYCHVLKYSGWWKQAVYRLNDRRVWCVLEEPASSKRFRLAIDFNFSEYKLIIATQ